MKMQAASPLGGLGGEKEQWIQQSKEFRHKEFSQSWSSSAWALLSILDFLKTGLDDLCVCTCVICVCVHVCDMCVCVCVCVCVHVCDMYACVCTCDVCVCMCV